MSTWSTMVEEVLLQPQPALVPPRRWGVEVDLSFFEHPRVLIIGHRLSLSDGVTLKARATLAEKATIPDGLELMVAEQWDVVSDAVLEQQGQTI